MLAKMKSFFGYLVCLALLGDRKVAFANDEAELVTVENRLDAIQSSLNLMYMTAREQIEALRADIRSLQHPMKCDATNSTPKPSEVTYNSCSDVPQRSGVYDLAVNGSVKNYKAYCEMNKFGGGWTVFQKRQDGSVDFNRSWTEYRNGFGDASGEYWLGLETLHELTSRKPHELLVILENFKGETSYRRYDGFFVKNETQLYQVFFNGTSSGNASESLNIFNGEKFATYDAPGGSFTNCARGYAGGFWFSHCASPVSRSSLNGVYGPRTIFRVNGIWWGGIDHL